MSSDDTPTETNWVAALKSGDEQAAQRLWEDYYLRLLAVARRRLSDVPRRAFDEEDVVLSAFNSFCARAAKDAFPQLNDRHDLWALLVTITARKVLQKKRQEMCQRRGAGKQRGESAFLGADKREDLAALSDIVGNEPSPQFAAEVSEQVEQLLLRLNDDSLQQIAVAKMEGWSNPEIAERLGLSDRTVRRKLKVIATIWENAE